MVPIVLLPPLPKDQVMVGSKAQSPCNSTEKLHARAMRQVDTRGAAA